MDVNAHITQNIKEYQAYCRSLYNGRYLADDLFQEFYLYLVTLPQERLSRYNSDGKLTCICKLIIKRMFLRRGRKTANGESQPLYETCTPCEVYLDFKPAENDPYIDTIDLVGEKVLTDLASDNWYNTAVLLETRGFEVQLDNHSGQRMLVSNGKKVGISDLSRRTKIDRCSLGKACKQAAMEIRRYVDPSGDH